MYPPPIELPPRPKMKMIPIKTFSFQKIENTQKNEWFICHFYTMINSSYCIFLNINLL